MRSIRVSIDRLVLKGFEPGDRTALVEALQSELSTILRDPATQVQSHRTPVLWLGRMPFERGPVGGRRLGNNVAQAIGRGLKP